MPESTSTMRVLIVDKDANDRALLRQALDRVDGVVYEVMDCEDPVEGRRLIQESPVDAVVVDYHLPGETSMSCVESLASEAEDAAILVMSGQPDAVSAVEVMKAGASDYLLKEILQHEPGRLDRALRTAVHAKRLERENRRLLQALRDRNLELERLNQKLWELSHTDELTGYYNRRHIMARLDEELARSLRYSLPMSVVMIDLDHFKEVNDRHGHPIGDRALQAVATLFRSCLRDTDLVGRVGGEEFLLILTNTDRYGATQFCNRIRQRLEELPIPVGNETLRLTASFGIAALSPDCETVTALLHVADTNLYAAKAQGRNRVVA